MFMQIGIFMDSIKQIEIKNRFISFATYYNEYSFLNWLFIEDISSHLFLSTFV